MSLFTRTSPTTTCPECGLTGIDPDQPDMSGTIGIHTPGGVGSFDVDGVCTGATRAAEANAALDAGRDYPDTYRVRVYRGHRRHLGRRPIGRAVWMVEVDYIGDWESSGDDCVSREWVDAPMPCAVARGVETARYIHGMTPEGGYDPGDGIGPLVVYVGEKAVIDERAEVAS